MDKPVDQLFQISNVCDKRQSEKPLMNSEGKELLIIQTSILNKNKIRNR